MGVVDLAGLGPMDVVDMGVDNPEIEVALNGKVFPQDLELNLIW